MRIVFDHQIFQMQRFGGVSRYFYELANRIKLDGRHSVDIVAPFYITEYFTRDSAVRPTGLKLASFPGSNYLRRRVGGVLSRQITRRLRGVDVFHETYFAMADGCPASAARVVTVHDMTHELFPAYFEPGDRTAEFKRAAVDRADHVICVSENTRRDLLSITGVPVEKTSVVHHGFSLTRPANPSRPASVRERRDILFVGTRSGYKNFSGLLEAYSRASALVRSCRLVCFGGGAFSDGELAAAEKLGVRREDLVQVSGDDAVLAGLYGQASAFVYPSLYEGFGIPLLEAMSFGCPVICSNTSSMPEVAADAAEFFDPSDASSMAGALDAVLSSGDRARDLSTRGLRRVGAFSWERCASEHIGAYERAMA